MTLLLWLGAYLAVGFGVAVLLQKWRWLPPMTETEFASVVAYWPLLVGAIVMGLLVAVDARCGGAR